MFDALVTSRRRRVKPLPPQLYFVASAIFHYLGPAFAVLLFARMAPLGVAWLRIASAALVFVAWRRPTRLRHLFRQADTATRWTMFALGAVLAAMNSVFYLALARLPLGTVGAIEFLGPIGLALAGTRTARNGRAFALVVAGVALLTQVRLVAEPLGYVFAFGNCALFVLYVMLGHRIAADGGAQGIDRLALAMTIAAVAALPLGFSEALPAFTTPTLLAAGIGVGVCSSVIPYVCDQLAMAQLPRATFALMLALLPAMATLIGIVVLHQHPKPIEMAGVALVIVGVAVHRDDRH